MSFLQLYQIINCKFLLLQQDTDKNTQRNDVVIPTYPNPVYGCKAVILVDSNVAYEGSKALSNTEPNYDVVNTGGPVYDEVDTTSTQ